MSPFVIYLIVLTIAYILLYATLITIDLTAKKKQEGAVEETINAGDVDDDQGYSSRVVQEGNDGGFTFESKQEPVESDTSEDVPDDAEEPSDIAEAAEESPLPLASLFGTVPSDETETDDTPSDEAAPQSEVMTDVEDQKEQTDSSATEDDVEEADSDDDEDLGIQKITFDENAPMVATESPSEDYPAFSPTLEEPEYEVSSIIEPPLRETSVTRHAATVNAALSSIEAKGNQYDSFSLRSVMSNKAEADKQQLDIEDEVTKI